jgi:hypothetical protein
MKLLLRAVAVLFVVIAAVLIYAVIAAVTSDGGAKAGVAIGYIVGSALLLWAAVVLWRRGPATPASP